MNYRDCYEEGRRVLAEAGIEESKLDARLLLEYICGTGRNDLLVHGEREVDENKRQRYEELIRKRAGHIPLQHLTGVQEFMGLKFLVNENVLIPRQDTEILVEEALKELHDGMRLLDMCTGSGCILISLLHYTNGCVGVGADISREALKVAKENAARLLGEYHRAEFIHSSLFEKVEGRFDMIVSNPPYIRSSVIETLMREVREHEPLEALDGREDGLYFYRQIVDESRKKLLCGGKLYFEIGYDQAQSVLTLMKSAGFEELEVVKDYAGLDRVVFGTWNGAECCDGKDGGRDVR